MGWLNRVFGDRNMRAFVDLKAAHEEIKLLNRDRKHLMEEYEWLDAQLTLAREEIRRFDEVYAAQITRENEIACLRKALRLLAHEVEQFLGDGPPTPFAYGSAMGLRRRIEEARAALAEESSM